MRMKRMIDGLDNGQKIRVIVDGGSKPDQKHP